MMSTNNPTVNRCTTKELLKLFYDGEDFENWSDEQIQAVTSTKGDKQVFFIRENGKISSLLITGYLTQSAQNHIIGLSDNNVGVGLLSERAYSQSPTEVRIVTSLLVDKNFAKSHLKALSRALKTDNKNAITIIIKEGNDSDDLLKANRKYFKFHDYHENLVRFK